MKRIVIFCALCALWGCKEANAPQTDPIALYYSIAEQSKTDLLTPGDEIGVFAAVAGTERYFLDNVKYIVGVDGRSLSTSPAVYYPEAKQAVVFTAYLPFGGAWSGALGTFSVPSDQTTTTALKQADLCWATANSTPVATPVALEFRHQMARLLITTNEPTEKIAIPNVFSGGILDIKTGAFTNTLRSEVLTTGTELILPAQSVTRLVLTVSGVDYTFEGAIALEAAKATSISLTFNPTTHTATLAGSSTTDWTSSAIQGNPTQAVSNVLTMHWPNYLPAGATPDKVVLTINNTDYTVSSGVTYADQTFTVPFASSALRYPYTITKIVFYNGVTQALPTCVQLVGSMIYKSTASTLGIKDPANAVKIGNLWWATGPLIAVSKDNNHECRIGTPYDGGLYFQFGSMIGYKGGNQANGGTGVGIPQAPLTTNGTYWNGLGYSWASDAMVWPSDMLGTPSSWADGKNYAKGDPCSYYLNLPWRSPTTEEIKALCNNNGGYKVQHSWKSCNAAWTIESVEGGSFAGGKLFVAASGSRYYTNGSFYHLNIGAGYFWSTSLYNAANGIHLTFAKDYGVAPQAYDPYSDGFPARCVRPI